MAKSLRNVARKRRRASTIFSFEIAFDTSASGMWIVIKPTRSTSLHIIIIGSPSNSAAKNSV